MENVFLTSLTAPEVRQLFRQELESYFEVSTLTAQGSSVNERPVSTKDLCAFLNITEPTVIRWRKRGKIPFIQIGSAYRYNLGDVIKALEVGKKIRS